MNEDLTRQLLRRIAALERRLGIVETSEAGAAHSHSSYLNRDGSVALTGDWDIGDGRKLLADVVRARDAAGLSLQDDGGNEALKVNDGGTLTLGNIVSPVRGASFRSGIVVIADDSVAQIVSGTPVQGIVIFYAVDSVETAVYGTINYRGNPTLRAIVSAAGGAVETVTGSTPTGTTGTDGRLTLFVNATGNVWFENRRGGSRSIVYQIIG